MAETHFYGQGWEATVLITDPPTDFYNAWITTMGETKELALSGAEFVLEILAKGRLAYIRVKPEANSDTDFDTKIVRHRGIARVSFKLESGCWNYPDDSPVRLGFEHA